MGRWIRYLLSLGEQNRLYTHAEVGVLYRGKEYLFSTDDSSSNYIFDIASLTKVVFTVNYFIHHVRIHGDSILNTPIKELVDLAVCPELERVTVACLLSHSSGLPPHRRFWETYGMGPVDIEVVASEILNTSPLFEPGGDVLYTDLGYILLGYLIKILEEKDLDRVFDETTKIPLGLKDTFFIKTNTSAPQKGRIVKTSPYFEETRVWDHNCYMLGGVSGHAGLFSSVKDLLGFCRYIISITDIPELSRFFRRENVRFTLGFDTPTGKRSTSGRLIDPLTIGHLGYTGTSIWIYPSKNLAVVFLSNRTMPGAPTRKFNHFRHTLHNAVFREFLGRR